MRSHVGRDPVCEDPIGGFFAGESFVFSGETFLKKISPGPFKKPSEFFRRVFSPVRAFPNGGCFHLGFCGGVFFRKKTPPRPFQKTFGAALGFSGETFFEKRFPRTSSKNLRNFSSGCFPPFGLFRTGTFFVAVFYRRLCSLDGGVFSCHFPVILVLCGSFFLTFYKKNQNFARKKVICDFPAYFI